MKYNINKGNIVKPTPVDKNTNNPTTIKKSDELYKVVEDKHPLWHYILLIVAIIIVIIIIILELPMLKGA